MSDSARQPPSGSPAYDLEKAVTVYERLGFSTERIAAQLVRTGYPLEAVRHRFPDIPESALPEPPKARRRAVVPTSESAQAGQGSRPTSKPTSPDARSTPSQLQGILQKLSDTRSSNTPAPHAPADGPTGRAASHPLPASHAAITPDQGMSFQYVPLIQCSFPHADPGDVTTHTRRNGWLELTLSTNHPDTGLPYGVPARLLTIYCTTEAVRTRSPEVDLGNSVHEFLRRLEVPITRGERGSLRVYANQLLRLAHCSLTIHEHIRDSAGRQGLDIRPCQFIERARLWWDHDAGVGKGSHLVLSKPLFESMLERSAPLSTAAIKQLRKSPMDLDVYAWLVHRLYHLIKPSNLSWQQLSGQFGHSYGEIRYFRRFFGDSLKRVQRVYPEARVKISEAGLLLLPSKPHIERRPVLAP